MIKKTGDCFFPDKCVTGSRYHYNQGCRNEACRSKVREYHRTLRLGKPVVYSSKKDNKIYKPGSKHDNNIDEILGVLHGYY